MDLKYYSRFLLLRRGGVTINKTLKSAISGSGVFLVMQETQDTSQWEPSWRKVLRIDVGGDDCFALISQLGVMN